MHRREIQGWMYQSWSKPLFAINMGRQFEHIWSVHITHSFSYLNACKCRVFRIASKSCKTILVTLDCSQCDGSRLKMYNRCHNMREWADTLQSLKLYLCVLSSIIKRCRQYHVIYFTNERYHTSIYDDIFCAPRNFVKCTSRIRNYVTRRSMTWRGHTGTHIHTHTHTLTNKDLGAGSNWVGHTSKIIVYNA